MQDIDNVLARVTGPSHLPDIPFCSLSTAIESKIGGDVHFQYFSQVWPGEDLSLLKETVGESYLWVRFEESTEADGSQWSPRVMIVLHDDLAGTLEGRFMVAHEIGHILLHIDSLPKAINPLRKFLSARDAESPGDIFSSHAENYQADYFAIKLMLSRPGNVERGPESLRSLKRKVSQRVDTDHSNVCKRIGRVIDGLNRADLSSDTWGLMDYVEECCPLDGSALCGIIHDAVRKHQENATRLLNEHEQSLDQLKKSIVDALDVYHSDFYHSFGNTLANEILPRTQRRAAGRRRGIAAKLNEALVAHASAHGLKGVFLSTSTLQLAAIALYVRLGYTQVRTSSLYPNFLLKDAVRFVSFERRLSTP